MKNQYSHSVLKVLCGSLLLLALSACGADSSDPNLVPTGAPNVTGQVPSGAGVVPAQSLKAQIEALEASGTLPKLDRSTSIPGPDVNNNGVRDDIEAYINSLPITDIQKRAAMQDAKATQMTLMVDLTDKVALQRVGDALMASTNCLGDKFLGDISYMSSRTQAMTANTRERAKQYMAYNAARSGSSTVMPSGNTCE